MCGTSKSGPAEERKGPAKGRADARPVVVISACLLSGRCRWDGDSREYPHLSAALEGMRLLPVCPETAAGLGVPRDPIRLVEHGGKIALIQPSTGKDIAPAIRRMTAAFLESAGRVDAFVLKSRSPSCAVSDADVFADARSSEPCGKRAGLFAEILLGLLPGAPSADEKALLEPEGVAEFREKLFENAADLKYECAQRRVR